MMSEIDVKGIIAIVGNFGSGKTEVAVNLAIRKKRDGLTVRIADLDIVNPYFRTREARGLLSRIGVDVVLPPEELLHADLPALSPAVAGMIRNPGELTILDVGGDDAGATVLASLADALAEKPVRAFQVINPFRPFTNTVQGCLEMRDRIEAASRIKIGGLIGNPHLMNDTTPEDVRAGCAFVRDVSAQSGLPLLCLAAADHLLPEAGFDGLSCPVLPIKRKLTFPWENAVNRGV
jgi:hypothetical protein